MTLLIWGGVLLVAALAFFFVAGTVTATYERDSKGVMSVVAGIGLFLAVISFGLTWQSGWGHLPNADDNNGLLSAGQQYEVLTSFEVATSGENGSGKRFAMLIKRPDGDIVSYVQMELPPPVFVYTPKGKSLFTAPDAPKK